MPMGSGAEARPLGERSQQSAPTSEIVGRDVQGVAEFVPFNQLKQLLLGDETNNTVDLGLEVGERLLGVDIEGVRAVV